MNITERYLSAYIFECLTGYKGDNPDYSSVLKTVTKRIRNPIMKKVMQFISASGDPHSRVTKRQVKKYLMEVLNAPRNIR